LAARPVEVKMATESLKEQGLENGQTAQALESYTNGLPNITKLATKKVELTPPKLERAPKETQQFIEDEINKINNLANPDKQQILNIVRAAKGENQKLNERLDRAYISLKLKLSYESMIMQMMALGLISIGVGSKLLPRKPLRSSEIANV
jgi:hypothetical protein